MATRADLVREVLQDLSVLDAVTDAPTAEDAAAVVNRIGPILAELASAEVCYIATPTSDDDGIEDAYFEPLVDYLVEKLAKKFGGERNLERMDDAKARLRKLSRMGRGTGRMLTVDPALRRASIRRSI
jgi:hypothetical protein